MSAGDNGRPERKILVVDDDPTVRAALEAGLLRDGYSVLMAADGQQGMEAYEHYDPDLVITDINMPVMNGYAFCTAVRETKQGQHTPILIMTGSEGFESVDAAYEVGATDFISKPLNFTLLLHRIRYILRSRDTFLAWQETQQQRATLGWVLNNSSSEILFVDASGKVTNANDSLLKNAGLSRDAVAGKRFDDFFVSSKGGKRMDLARKQVISGMVSEAEFSEEVKRADGSSYSVEGHIYSAASESSRARDTIFMFEDVTQRKLSERRMHKLAYYDGLTNLPNRTLFVKNCKRHIELANRHDYKMALLFVDLDNFKDVNDTLGHNAGDELLRRVSQIILGSIRAADLVGALGAETLSRFGGDEFAILLSHISRHDDAIDVAERIIKATKTPVLIEGRELVVTPSIGVVFFPEHGSDVGTLLKKADIAMYAAKKRGRSIYQIYSDSFVTYGLDKQEMLRDLESAVDRDELVLHYQPKFFTGSNEICGFEALLRWNRRGQGLVSSDAFIPLAEESGLLRPIGAWVIWQVCQQISTWRSRGVPFPTEVAVNLSAVQLHDNDVVTTVEKALYYYNVEPAALTLEITETAMIQNISCCLDILSEFKTMGCQLSLDDFGTGYSSLSYLSQFPLDELKVDRTFIARSDHDEGSRSIIRAIVAMAKSLDMQLVAEGVETSDQLHFINEIGIDQFQGYLRAKPMTIEDIESRYVAAQPAIHGDSSYRSLRAVR